MNKPMADECGKPCDDPRATGPIGAFHSNQTAACETTAGLVAEMLERGNSRQENLYELRHLLDKHPEFAAFERFLELKQRLGL